MSFYNKLPLDILSQFHFEISKNIEKEILTETMLNELNLIKKVAEEKGVYNLPTSTVYDKEEV